MKLSVWKRILAVGRWSHLLCLAAIAVWQNCVFLETNAMAAPAT